MNWSDPVAQWHHLDPSWKFRDFQPGTSGILAAVPFDRKDYLFGDEKGDSHQIWVIQVDT